MKTVKIPPMWQGKIKKNVEMSKCFFFFLLNHISVISFVYYFNQLITTTKLQTDIFCFGLGSSDVVLVSTALDLPHYASAFQSFLHTTGFDIPPRVGEIRTRTARLL